jgi:hypothetical protein
MIRWKENKAMTELAPTPQTHMKRDKRQEEGGGGEGEIRNVTCVYDMG